MTRTEIEALPARVRGATEFDREIDAAFHALMHGIPFRFVGERVEMEYHHADDAEKRWHKSHDTRGVAGASVSYVSYTGSLDAIVGLIERQLGRWDISIDARDEGWFCWIEEPHSRTTNGEGYGTTRPLALCAAFLNALLSTLPDEDKSP